MLDSFKINNQEYQLFVLTQTREYQVLTYIHNGAYKWFSIPGVHYGCTLRVYIAGVYCRLFLLMKEHRKEKHKSTIAQLKQESCKYHYKRYLHLRKNMDDEKTTTTSTPNKAKPTTTPTSASATAQNINASLTKSTTSKHQGRKKHKCEHCDALVYHLARHKVEICQ